MSNFYEFELERMQSVWENVVDYDLSESGIFPTTLSELLGDQLEVHMDRILSVKLNYAQTNGTEELRAGIAAMYDGAGVDNVIVTVGCAEANYIAMHTVIEPEDHAVVMTPDYMQVWGICKNRGIDASPFYLREENAWSPDLDQLSDVANEKTKLIAVCNPNNPTGRILTEHEMDEIVRVAQRSGAWILADEVYRGCELETDDETPSFYGRYDKVIATCSLSKTYGLPGLRIGWAVAPQKTVGDLWARHDYTTIGTTMLGNMLGALALTPEVRPRLVKRGRDLVRGGLEVLRKWIEQRPDVFNMTSPQATPIAFARYDLDIDSVSLVKRLLEEQSVLIVAGAHFGMDGFVRFRHGLPTDYLSAGLERVGRLIDSLNR